MGTNITKEKFVFFAVIILALMFGYNVVYKGKLNKIRQLKSEIKKEEEKNKILNNVSLLDGNLRLYQKRSFSTTEITGLVDRISQLAGKAGVTINNFNPGQKRSMDAYMELPLVMSFECGYHKLGSLLGLIESNQEFIWVKGLKMIKSTVPGGQESAQGAQVVLTVSGFYLKD